MKDDPKLTKAYEIIAHMGNHAQIMRKSIELLINIAPREELIKALAELHDRRLGELRR